jgi:hypothetical protein
MFLAIASVAWHYHSNEYAACMLLSGIGVAGFL